MIGVSILTPFIVGETDSEKLGNGPRWSGGCNGNSGLQASAEFIVPPFGKGESEVIDL